MKWTHRTLITVLLAMLLFVLVAFAVSADPISLTAYVTTATDMVNGMQAELPGMLTLIIAVGAGIVFLGIVWALLKRFVK